MQTNHFSPEKKMSNYMNYAEASKIYDEARVAADADLIYDIFTGLLKKEPNEVWNIFSFYNSLNASFF